jgi:hypothetical protein
MHISITAEVAPGKFAAALDLAQRRDHGVGILGEFDRAGVGQNSRERDSASRMTCDNPDQRDQRHRDDDDNRNAAAGAPIAVVEEEDDDAATIDRPTSPCRN